MGWLTLATLWWLFFWTAIGLCVGSFLNVVIYRLPRNRSLRDPVWSACPNCEQRIRWYDNLPILSYLRLRGRCRHCKQPISPRYLVVEALMAVIVLMLLDAFFVGRIRHGLCDGRFGLTEQLTYDWPILVSHIILFACLFSMSAIDIEHYWVDVRFTNLATIAGFVLHMLWTPHHSMVWPRPGDTTAVTCVFAMLGLGAVWLVMVCRPHVDPEDYGFDPRGDSFETPPPHADAIPAQNRRTSVAFAIAVVFVLVGLAAVLTVVQLGYVALPHAARALIPLALMFGLIVQQSTVNRESDQQIIQDIHDERHTARTTALFELGLLIPAILLAGVGYWLMTDGPTDWSQRFSTLLHERIPIHALPMMRGWAPLYGLATAATGYVVAGALGWVVRIVFTLAFGKEAFGTGDIHIMAAAGCIAGWPIVVLGFFLTCGLAMVGWVLTLPFKRARAIPLGPWLALSFLALVLFYEPIVSWSPLARTIQALSLMTTGSANP